MINVTTWDNSHCIPLPDDIVEINEEYSTTGDATGGNVIFWIQPIRNPKKDYHIYLKSLDFRTNDLSLTNTIGNRQLYPYLSINKNHFPNCPNSRYPIILEEEVSNYLSIPYQHRHLDLNLGKRNSRGSTTIIYLYFPSNVNAKDYICNIQYYRSKNPF